jgi:hypothetical protein
MKAQYVVLLPVVVAVVGCASPAPVAQNFDVSYQKVARTAHHWDVVAEDVVSQTMQAIAEKAQLQNRGVHVAPSRSTAFNTAFREFLITHLVDRGASVSACKVGHGAAPGFAEEGPDMEVQYDSQLVVHGSDTADYTLVRLTALAAGVAVVRNVARADFADVNAALIGAAALADLAAGHRARPTRTEIIVTTTLVERNRFVARTSDVYYVPDADAQLFIQRVAQRSTCPDDKPIATVELGNDDKEGARQEMIERGMRRTNPNWRPTTYRPQTAYSY